MSIQTQIKKAEYAAKLRAAISRIEHWLSHADNFEIEEVLTTTRCIGHISNGNSTCEPDGGLVIRIKIKPENFNKGKNVKWRRTGRDQYEVDE